MNNPDKGKECERVKEGLPPALFQRDGWRLKRILITAILITKAKAPFRECPADWIFLSLFLPFHFLQTTTALSLPLEQNLEHLSQALKCQEKAWMGGNLVPPALPCLDILLFMDIGGGGGKGGCPSDQHRPLMTTGITQFLQHRGALGISGLSLLLSVSVCFVRKPRS